MKRATVLDRGLLVLCTNFNPRPREEGDLTAYLTHGTLTNFNPRPREEGDSHICLRALSVWHFNPRPREEGDLCIAPGPTPKAISIHALVKRATDPPLRIPMYFLDFNPRPREEGDSIVVCSCMFLTIFQSTPS